MFSKQWKRKIGRFVYVPDTVAGCRMYLFMFLLGSVPYKECKKVMKESVCLVI